MAVLKMTIFSEALRMHTDVSIFLPTFKNQEDRGIVDGMKRYVPGMKYQVLYLLHGGAGNHDDYINFSSIVRYADENKIAVIMPTGYASFYTDDPNGPKYYSYVAEELPQICKSLFPISDDPEDVFIGGHSMGAVGAFKLATAYPERYNSVLCLSGGGRGPGNPANGIEHTFLKHFAKPIVNEWDDPWTYLPKQVAAGKPMPKFFFTCGSDDQVAYPDYVSSAARLKELGLTVENKEVAGYQHEWAFWDLAIKDAMYHWLPLKRKVLYPDEA